MVTVRRRGTHPLGQHNSQEKDGKKSSTCKPAIQHMGSPAVENLLVLPLNFGVLGSDVLNGRRVCTRAREGRGGGVAGGHHGGKDESRGCAVTKVFGCVTL